MASYFPESDKFPNQPVDFDLCTLDICPLSRSIFRYQPSLPMAIAPLALFGALAVGHAISGWHYRTWTYTISILIGLCLELAGYVGRILAHGNPFPESYYLLQIVVLTVAPVLFCAAIYICLGRIVLACGTSMSRLRAAWYTPIFLTCDVVSLILQGVGGALTSTAETSAGRQRGINVMLGGLGFQVATITTFGLFFIEYMWRVRTVHTLNADLETSSLLGSKRGVRFLWSLGSATILVLIRSIYRVAEMSSGYDGALMTNQVTFLVFEGVLIIIAVLLLLVFHPGSAIDGFSDSVKSKLKKDSKTAPGSTDEELDTEPKVTKK